MISRRHRSSALLSRTLARRDGVGLQFDAGDIRQRLPDGNHSIDICLCLHAVLNHLEPEDLPGLFSEIARVTKGSLLVTIRAIGSRPAIYVDSVKAARAYHQDNVHGRPGVEFQDGSQTSMPYTC